MFSAGHCCISSLCDSPTMQCNSRRYRFIYYVLRGSPAPLVESCSCITGGTCCHPPLWLLSAINSATPARGLHLVLQLNPIHVNGSKLQYLTQPIDRGGAAFGRKQPFFFLILDNPFKAKRTIKGTSGVQFGPIKLSSGAEPPFPIGIAVFAEDAGPESLPRG